MINQNKSSKTKSLADCFSQDFSKTSVSDSMSQNIKLREAPELSQSVSFDVSIKLRSCPLSFEDLLRDLDLPNLTLKKSNRKELKSVELG